MEAQKPMQEKHPRQQQRHTMVVMFTCVLLLSFILPPCGLTIPLYPPILWNSKLRWEGLSLPQTQACNPGLWLVASVLLCHALLSFPW